MYWRTRCLTCGVEADYKFDYVLDKNTHGEKVCRACYWFAGGQWAGDVSEREAMVISVDEIRERAKQVGLELARTLRDDTTWNEPVVTRCRRCGVVTVDRVSDLVWGCTCNRSTGTARTATRTKGKDLFHSSSLEAVTWWDHEMNSEDMYLTVTPRARRSAAWICPDCGLHFDQKIYVMADGPRCPACEKRRADEWREQHEHLKITPIAAVPKLAAAWDDADDPNLVMVGGWGLRKFCCPNGHHPKISPTTYLSSGCPFCRARNFQETGQSLAQASPEVAEQWHPTRNGKRVPHTIGHESKRTIWWRSQCCGHEWEATPRDRSRPPRLRCPACESILDSLAWHDPGLAAEWSPDNPVTPWHVRPSGTTPFMPKWVCATNTAHTWEAPVASRSGGADCPECREAGKSKVELAYFEAAAQVFGSAKSGEQLRDPAFNTREIWTADDVPVVIEYDGEYWHSAYAERLVDERKTLDLLAAGRTVVRLRENTLPMLDLTHPRLLQLRVYSTASTPATTMNTIAEWLGAQA